jgi:hypothetical protein
MGGGGDPFLLTHSRSVRTAHPENSSNISSAKAKKIAFLILYSSPHMVLQFHFEILYCRRIFCREKFNLF